MQPSQIFNYQLFVFNRQLTSRRLWLLLALRGEARKEYKYPIPLGGIRHHHVGNRSDKFAVLYDWAATHECGQVGTTVLFKEDIK